MRISKRKLGRDLDFAEQIENVIVSRALVDVTVVVQAHRPAVGSLRDVSANALSGYTRHIRASTIIAKKITGFLVYL